MKGFSIPNISIPNISIPNISLNGTNINVSSIQSAIESAIPDIQSIAKSFNIESEASNLLSEALGEGIDLPSELSGLLK